MKLLSTLLLVILVVMGLPQEIEAQQPTDRPTLTTHIKRGTINPRGESVDFDVLVTSRTQKDATSLIYVYEFINQSAVDAKLLPLLVTSRNRIEFVAEFITDPDKSAESRAGKGEIIINLKAGERKVFTVKDDSPEIEMIKADMSFIYENGSAGPTAPLSIYFPRWEQAFGQ